MTTQTSVSYPNSNSPRLVTVHFSTYSMPEGTAKNKTLLHVNSISTNNKTLKQERKGELLSKFAKNMTYKYYPATSYFEGSRG